jgi:hypothetical protein
MFHPATGQCVTWKLGHQLQLGSCDQSTAWKYTEEGNIKLIKVDGCVKAGGIGEPTSIVFGYNCAQEKWEQVSASKMHLASMSDTDGEGNRLCLDVGDDGKTMVTKPCKCLSDDHNCDPTSQWFKLVNSTRIFQ